MRAVRRSTTVAAIAGVPFVTLVLACAVVAPAALAFGTWAHDGAVACSACHSGGTGPATDASCTGCHGSSFKAYPGRTCWSCHYPGQDTSTLSSPSSACSQDCHLYRRIDKAYTEPFSHTVNPHLGSQGTADGCLDCHETSTSVFNAGQSPHHSGQATGFDECGVCHSGYQRHADEAGCLKCHPQAEAFHTYTATSPGFKKCGSCHAMRHAGTSVSQGKCANCHKGKGSGPAAKAQHAASITKRFVCGSCHSQKLHASAVSNAVRNCRTCHSGRYHAAQKTPSKSVCTTCHSVALRHDNGYSCMLCHRRAVHSPRPSAVN